MFWQIAGFMLLSALAAGGVGGIMILRRMASVVALRAKLEGTKTKRLIAEVEHSLQIEEFKYGQSVLALTEGDSTKAEKTVKPIDVPIDEVVHPREDADASYRLRSAAVDASFSKAR